MFILRVYSKSNILLTNTYVYVVVMSARHVYSQTEIKLVKINLIERRRLKEKISNENLRKKMISGWVVKT